MIGIFAVNENL